MVNHLTNYPHKKLASKSTVNNILPKKNPYTVITLETRNGTQY